MLQKMTQEELQNSTVDALEQAHSNAEAYRDKLQTIKSKGERPWTQKLQEDLDNTVLYLVDIEDAIEEKQKEEKKEESKAAEPQEKYTPRPGTENMVHLSLVKGRRFNPMTGKEEGQTFTQIFSFPEWQLFKRNFKGLGYTILKVLHDPFGEAKNLVG